MEFTNITYESVGTIAILSLNRPESLNALNEGMREELKEALTKAESDKNSQVVVLTGKGRAFCAGADLSRFKSDYEQFERTGEASGFYDIALPRIFSSFPKPLVAAVNGPAIGVGMTMVLACDIRLASASASFSCPFTRIGLTPEFGSTYHLPRLVGYARAAEWLLTGKTILPNEALSAGLVNQVAPPEALLDEAMKIAKRISSMPEEATLETRRLLREGLYLNLDETLQKETKAFQDCQKTRSHYIAVCELLKQVKAGH